MILAATQTIPHACAISQVSILPLDSFPSTIDRLVIKGNVSRWIYDGVSQSVKSSITIMANSFVLSNQTYQWMVRLTNRRNISQQATGYVLVLIEGHCAYDRHHRVSLSSRSHLSDRALLFAV